MTYIMKVLNNVYFDLKISTVAVEDAGLYAAATQNAKKLAIIPSRNAEGPVSPVVRVHITVHFSKRWQGYAYVGNDASE